MDSHVSGKMGGPWIYEFVNIQTRNTKFLRRIYVTADELPSTPDEYVLTTVVMLFSMLILMLLMGRAIYVAVSSDATLKGISIFIVYSLILILVGFIEVLTHRR